MSFRAPVRDLAFALTEQAGIDALAATGAFPDFDREIMEAVLEAAGTLAEEVLAPLNREGDRVGARLENGKVITPPGFRDAYKAFAEGGWNGLAADAAFGGQGLPRALSLAVFEMAHAANMAFALCPTLTQGAIEALSAHGTDAQKALYLPRLISGEWPGTMNLTEPQAGTDLALLRTRAEPDGEGGWKLFGEKIFITWGDHDCSDNIVHLVLARLPDAPEGVRGISLFLANRQVVGEDGSLGPANALRAASLEHKLGIHGSPTCVMLYEGATAELIGAPHQGLAAMFTMMNAARVNVGAQGVGIAERAYQQALSYAQDRRQSRSPWSKDQPAAIIHHPEIRRSLALMKAKIDAARAICLSTAVAADLAVHAATPEDREAARRREDLFTPVAKAWSTDIGVEVASAALQVHGGMGYIEETGAAQHYRDARIAPIYEGTNAIQALDLAGRKLSVGEGQAAREVIADIRRTLPALTGALARFGERLSTAVDALEAATAWMVERRGTADSLASATAYLQLMAEATGGWMLAKGALAGPDGPRPALARIYGERVLTGAPGLAEAVASGAEDLEGLSAEMLGG